MLTDDTKSLLKLLLVHGHCDAQQLADETNWDPERLSDAVELLEEERLVEVGHYIGSHPYAFSDVELNARGRAVTRKLFPNLTRQ